MAVMTIAFCDNCKWRSSGNPHMNVAGAPCPTCGSGVSDIHYDPAYTGTDQFGGHYVEAEVVAEHLSRHGISTNEPKGVALPTRPAPHGAGPDR